MNTEDFKVLKLENGNLICSFTFENKNYFAKDNDGFLTISFISDNKEDCSEVTTQIVSRKIDSYSNVNSFKEELKTFCLSLKEVVSLEKENVYIVLVRYGYQDLRYEFYKGSRNVEYNKPEASYMRQNVFINSWNRSIFVERRDTEQYSNKYTKIDHWETIFIDSDLNKIFDSLAIYNKELIECCKDDIEREEAKIITIKEKLKRNESEANQVDSLRNSIIFTDDYFLLAFDRKD